MESLKSKIDFSSFDSLVIPAFKPFEEHIFLSQSHIFACLSDFWAHFEFKFLKFSIIFHASHRDEGGSLTPRYYNTATERRYKQNSKYRKV